MDELSFRCENKRIYFIFFFGKYMCQFFVYIIKCFNFNKIFKLYYLFEI